MNTSAVDRNDEEEEQLYGGLKTSPMPTKLSTLVLKIQNIPNQYNSQIIYEFYQFMKENGASDKHITNELHTML